MRSKKSWFYLLLLTLFLTFNLISCGGGGGGGGGTATPPEWFIGYPTSQAIDTNMYVKARLNETGTVYCVIIPNGAAAPSATQVKNGQNAAGNPALFSASGASNSTTVSTLKITGLAYSTAYDVYCAAEDTTPTLQASATKMDTSTTAQDTLFVAKSGNDGNPGTIESPKLTIVNALGAVTGSITKVYVSAGTYNENVDLSNGASLYGGFSTTDWSDRNITDRTNTTYRTLIQGISTTGTGFGVRFIGTSSNPWILEGFVIEVNHTGNSHGVRVDSINGTATIRYNTISGGPGLNESNGIYVNGPTSKMVVSDNNINGGASSNANSSGILIETAADQIITDNTINGGSGFNRSVGVFISYPLTSTSVIARNNINGGSNPSISAGFYLLNGTDSTSLQVVIHSNYIHAGAGGWAYGIYTWAFSAGRKIEPRIFNNVIEATDAGIRAIGIHFENVDGSPLVYNNTIAISSVSDQSYGIHTTGTNTQLTSADIRNNIILCESAIDHDFGLLESGNYGLSSYIQNNDIFGCGCIINSEGIPYGTIALLNGLRPTATSGNIDADPVLSASPDRNLTATSPTSVTQGGLDLSGVATFPESSGSKIDKAGTQRTAPWSIGAYERD